MKQTFLNRRSTLLLLALFTMFVGGVSPAWADNADFENALPEGWETVGTMTYYDERSKTGSYSIGNSYNNGWDTNRGNYIKTTELEGTVTLWVRSYSNKYTGYVSLYKLSDDGTTVGDKLTSFSSSSTEFAEKSYELTEATRLAIVINYAHLDNMTYTIAQAVEGPALTVKDGSTKISTGYAYNFGLATAGTTKTFTLSNPGTAAVEGLSVAETGNFGATLSATSIAAGGEATLTVTMPAATGNSAITISSTTDGIADFVINASGTIRDPNKLWCNFSSGLPDDWTNNENYTITTSGAGEGTSNGGYAGQTSYSYKLMYTPLVTVAEGEKIYLKVAGYGSTAGWNSMEVRYSADGSNWTTAKTISNIVKGTWTEVEVTEIPAGQCYIGFYGRYVYLTDIYGGQPSDKPKALSANNITYQSADITWNAGTGNETAWELYYGTSNTPGSGTKVDVSTTPSQTISGLEANTTYYVYVRGVKGVSSYTDWSSEMSFTTSLAPISEYPYTENFNSLSSGEIPTGWDNSEGTTTTASYKWTYYATGHDGAGLRFDSYNNKNNYTNLLKTRPFSWTSDKTMKLSFWYKNPKGGDFTIYVSKDGGETLNKTLATGLTGQTNWIQQEYTILPSDEIYGENVVFVFKGTSNYGSGDAYIYLDDVAVSEVTNHAMSVSGTDVSESTIAFGTVKNTTTTKTFTISNDGSEALTGVSVVSSDAEVFTVSETGFDIAVGDTKDITVTFVKGVDGEYSKTVTVSQANIATPIVLNVTATYQTPTPATMAITIDEVAVGATVAFGNVNKAKSKTFTVTNTGEATLDITSIVSDNTTDFTVTPATLAVNGGETGEFTVTFVYDGEALDAEKTANITITPSNAGLDPVVFAVTGTRVDMWSEDFEGGSIPAGWDYSGFVVKTGTVGTWPTYELPTYFAVGTGGSGEKTLITPLLKATAGDKLTFDGFFYYGDETLKVDYSTDLSVWNNIYTYDKSSYGSGSTHNIEIEAPVTGEFYLRFVVSYYNGVDNIEGFKLAPAKEHEAVIASKNIPATGNQYVEYTATVTVDEKAGKEEELTAKFYIGDTQYGGNVVKTVEANGSQTFTFTFTPAEAISGDAYFTVSNGDISLSTANAKVAVAIAAATVLDETEAPELAEGNAASMVVKYTAKNGWNTIAMPFELTSAIMNSIFGEGWKAYEFKGYNTESKELNFKSTTTFYAGYPYIVYVGTAAEHAEGVKFTNVNIAKTTAQADTYNDVSFQGTYAPMAAGSLTGNYGVTGEGKIQKAGESASMKGFRAYFTGVPAGARIALYDETTGITRVIAADDLDNVKGAYDLNGRRVARTQKGIYIVNGKKVVVK